MNYELILKKYWGYDSFRGIQKEIIESIGEGGDTLGLMPTGGGKSITFQVPALAMEGTCLVITPLIALMKDQVQHLTEHGIKAAALYSGMSRSEIVVTLENCIFGGIKFLYVSPERLGSELFQKKLRHMNVSFITVDEAHCISQWGYDFRPSYLEIAKIRTLLAQSSTHRTPPILALTATATPQVVEDICHKLTLPSTDNLPTSDFRVFRMSFERKNLAYIVRNAEDKFGQLLHILNSVGGSAIVYTRSRRRTKETAEWLTQQGISATFFHAGLDHAVKDDRQQRWQRDEMRVICATNAFGMGIDKPNVRLVIHIDCPDSIEAYFQEAGRAGRDGMKAYAVLLFNQGDKQKLHKRIQDTFPPKEYIQQVYDHLAYYYQIGVNSGMGHSFSFEIDKFCQTFHHFPVVVDSALKLLMRSGYLYYETDPEARARVRFLLGRDELYRLQEVTPHEEAVITSLLRNYGGLFTDYSYIDESLVAEETSLNRGQVYLCLKALGQRRILHFIPERKTPFITYTRNRAETEYVIIPEEVYEQRLEQYKKRIDAIINYACNDEICRQHQLLHYFGESLWNDCGHCDVCIDHKEIKEGNHFLASATNSILHLLSDKRKHHVSELRTLNIPQRHLHDALRDLVHEETISVEDSFLFLNSKN